MQIPAELKAYGLVTPQTPKRRRLVLSVEADEGCGKSRLGLYTAPRPLLVVNLDKNIEGLEENVANDEVLIYNVDMPEDVDEDADFKQWKDVQKLILTCIHKHYFRSIFIDTWDAMWELCRRGYLGKDGLKFGGDSQTSYTEPNAAMRKIIRAAKQDKSVNLILAIRTTDERKDGISASGKKTSIVTGKRVASGWKHTRFEAQCHVRLEKDKDWRCERSACKKGCVDPDVHRLDRFTCTIMKCTANERVEGEVLVGTDITFANLGMMVFPKTQDTPEVWEDGAL